MVSIFKLRDIDPVLRPGPALPSAGPQSQGPLRAPQTTIFIFYDVLIFSVSLRIYEPQSKAMGGVLFTTYLASIQYFNTLESLDLFFFRIQ